MAHTAKSASSSNAAEVLGLGEIGRVRRHQRRSLLQRHRVVERVEQVMVELLGKFVRRADTRLGWPSWKIANASKVLWLQPHDQA